MNSFYSGKADGFEQSQHISSLTMSRSMRSMTQRELGDRTNSGISPAAELDGKLRNPQRRRVPVAVCTLVMFEVLLTLTHFQCERCRKRKIKCSGDSGDGQACSNCRSAGHPNCQFLRVSLHERGRGWDQKKTDRASNR